MHYKNGREAKEYDPVVTKDYTGKVVVGVVSNLNPASDTCNCSLPVIAPGQTYVMTCQNPKNMYHAEDALLSIDPLFAKP